MTCIQFGIINRIEPLSFCDDRCGISSEVSFVGHLSGVVVVTCEQISLSSGKK